MRRSIRDAIVGLSLIGAIAGFGGTLLWLRGVRLTAKTWRVTASFENASGLTKRSPIKYRGILIGSIKDIKITPRDVKATLEIDKSDLILPLPVFAKVVTSSVLGGDVQVSLISSNKDIPLKPPMPMSNQCIGNGILCEGDEIKGESLMNISTLTEEFEKILQKAESQNVISTLVDSTKQFDKTQKNLDELIVQAKSEIDRAMPIINNLIIASNHIQNILASIDNPETLNDLKQTAKSTRSLTKKIDNIGSDMSKIMEDEQLMNALRNVTIGLGEFFNEIYPSKTKTYDINQ